MIIFCLSCYNRQITCRVTSCGNMYWRTENFIAENYDFTFFFLQKSTHDFQSSSLRYSATAIIFIKRQNDSTIIKFHKITFYPKINANKNVAFLNVSIVLKGSCCLLVSDGWYVLLRKWNALHSHQRKRELKLCDKSQFDAYIQKQNVSLTGWISSLDMVTERYVLCIGMTILCYVYVHTVKS